RASTARARAVAPMARMQIYWRRPRFRGGIPAFPRRYAWVSSCALGFQFCTDRRSFAVTDSLPASRYSRDVVVIGGCGHVGLPLAIALADRGATVAIYDVSTAAVDM